MKSVYVFIFAEMFTNGYNIDNVYYPTLKDAKQKLKTMGYTYNKSDGLWTSDSVQMWVQIIRLGVAK